MKIRNKIGSALALAWMIQVLPAAAEWKPSPAEMAALPPYCAARFDEKSAAFKSWRESMGSDFIHVHHYCAGLNFLNKARSQSSSKNVGTLEAAVRECDYVLTHASPGFYLRAEILMNRGIALSLMKRDGEAVSNLLKSIELDAKQPRAYVALADLYEKQNNRGKALDTVSEGLRHKPDTKSLQRRYTELGGKLPYPAPLQAARAEAPAEKVDGASTAIPVNPEVSTAVTPAAEPPAPPKIGSPTNPYCRFCPD